MTFTAFTAAVNALRREFAISCTGWGRTPARNKRVGGVPNSQHLKWLAVDIVRDKGVNKPALIARARGLGLEVVDEHDHIHMEAPTGSGGNLEKGKIP